MDDLRGKPPIFWKHPNRPAPLKRGPGCWVAGTRTPPATVTWTTCHNLVMYLQQLGDAPQFGEAQRSSLAREQVVLGYREYVGFTTVYPPGKLTWNLRITLVKRRNTLPNLHFWVPCLISGVLLVWDRFSVLSSTGCYTNP